ncbi:hypothetical protein HWV62_45284 [Athelia sp. TMB]|nr:hypothetical protein HWV62_45284 [Athelia sp. TMB]
MASNITIIPAGASDLPTLAHIISLAMQVDLINRLLFPDSVYDLTSISKALLALFEKEFREPNTHFFKAIDNATGEIVGFGEITFHENAAPTLVAEPEEEHGGQAPPEGMNLAFAGRFFGGLEEKRKQQMSTYPKYVEWRGLHVKPGHQRRGIGSALLKYGFETLKADELPVWLYTQMRGRNLYLQRGFKDLEPLDIDLKDYMGELIVDME